ncbi:MAG: hypothetical protein KDA24_23020 [Deltaproteobacteria bacterium]|nr:hypothetical protein [Deltaproteobacteria bacterium]
MSPQRAALWGLTLLLLVPSLSAAQAPPKVEFEMDGYWRTRAHAFFNLFDKQFPKDGGRNVDVYYLEDPSSIPQEFVDGWNTNHLNYTQRELQQGYCYSYPAQCRQAIKHPDRTHWISQRARFEPIVKFGDRIKLQATIDVLDNVIWGDNENLAQTPLFAEVPSNTTPDGTVTDAIFIRRLWVEWTTAFGLVRIGRQPSHWGLGILAHDGNGFKNDFGDSYDGATFDRIVFATRPISVVRGLASTFGNAPAPDASKDPFILAFAFDKLVNSAPTTFRKQLTDDETLSDENAEGDAFIRRSPIWLSDAGDDVWETVLALMFRKENWELGKEKKEVMDLTVGFYLIHRWQAASNSKAWIPDLYVNWKFRGFFVQGEAYWIVGNTEAIAPTIDKTTQADLFGTVWRAGYENPAFTGLFEVGHASGDDVIITSENDVFSGRPLHSDFNVGLILYEQMLAQRTVEKFVGDPDTQGLWSNGGVYNSTYINPRFKFRPGDITEFRLGLLAAWADEVDGAVIPTLDREDGTNERDDGNITESKFLGFEVDVGVHFTWAEGHIMLSFEGGYMRAGPRLGRMTQYLDPADGLAPTPYTKAQYDQIARRLNNIGTLQSRVAFLF